MNEVSKCLHEMTGTEQRVTSAYHPQSNGLCERQNRTIKDSLIKVLEENPNEWPNIIEGILFAHRVSVHYSTKFSPFYLMYNRHPTLPIDIKYDLTDPDSDNVESDGEPFDIETFRSVVDSAKSLRENVHQQAGQNIKKAQVKQQKDYNNRHSTPNATLPIGSKVLLENQKRKDRKGGKFTYRWLGPYTLKSISKSGLCSLVNKNNALLKKKYNASLLKPYNSNNDTSPPPGSQNSSDFTDPVIKDNTTSTSQNNSPQEQSKMNFFDQLPNELVQIILIKSTTLDNYASVRKTCQRFKILLEDKVEDILPMVHINFPGNLYNSLPRRSNRIKVSVRKLTKALGQGSGSIKAIRDGIAKKNWRSAWLLMEKRNRDWFVIRRAFWKSKSNDGDANEVFWLRNELYFLKEADRLILLSENEWLTDNIMDAAQKLICKQVGALDSY